MKTLLIANRGEIAIRIARSAAEAGLTTVVVHGEDDADALHVRAGDRAVALRGQGPAPYLDAAQLVAAALATGCDAVHPGYGFLSERPDFARACLAAGLQWVGPSPDTLALLGDKARARALAAEAGLPVLAGTHSATSLAEAEAFFAAHGAGRGVMVKAIAGGGGRGMRPVHRAEDLAEAWARCRSEAQAAFGHGEVYVEQFFPRARHIEVQVAGDGHDALHLWERECSLQRQRQKLVEIAPAPGLDPALRQRLLDAAVALARAARLDNLATVEFLVDAGDHATGAPAFAFIEANARLQVEHTVTEAVTGLDLVALQLGLARGQRLADLGLDAATLPTPRGTALQARVNLETMAEDGSARPTAGRLTAYEPPGGWGLRVDGCGYAGWQTQPRFDPLLAKLIVHVSETGDAGLTAAARKAVRALGEFRLTGVDHNIGFLQALLRHPALSAAGLHTRFVDEHLAALRDASPTRPRGPGPAAPEGHLAVAAPMLGTIVALEARAGEPVHAGQPLLVLEAMKMQHLVTAPAAGLLQGFAVAVGDTVAEGQPLAHLLPSDGDSAAPAAKASADLEAERADLSEVQARQAGTHDAARPAAVARRRATGQRTARENIADLVDAGSFQEYGSLVVAARRRTQPMAELIATTPADGVVTGLARVNGAHFADDRARVAVVAYDYTVMAGTQGRKGHEKQDRLFKLAEDWRLPLVLFAEGGGGRGSDTDTVTVGSLQLDTFHRFARLSGLVPLVGIASGRCFAGNAVLLGCCDVVIATADANIGMGGPAMIEGGGLGVHRPEDVGPMAVQVPNGVVDIAVRDEAEAVRVARQYLSYFQGPVVETACADQRALRHVVPTNRLRAYDMRQLIGLLADEGSVLELRRGFGAGMVTALARIAGRPIGIVANHPGHLSGAIDAAAADKAARFMQLCDAHDLPLLFLCDTPGNLVGPEAERTALVRHCCRTYLVGANVSVPTFTVVIRKGYGLGALGMAGGSFHAPVFTVAWPTGEFGGMNLEGLVKVGQRKALEAVADPAERRALYDRLVAEAYERGKALNTASIFEIDQVIDPADTRDWIVAGLRAMPAPAPRSGKKRPFVDAW